MAWRIQYKRRFYVDLLADSEFQALMSEDEILELLPDDEIYDWPDRRACASPPDRVCAATPDHVARGLPHWWVRYDAWRLIRDYLAYMERARAST